VKYFYEKFPEVVERTEKREKAISAGRNELDMASLSVPSLVD
jgi:hypothetical protein